MLPRNKHVKTDENLTPLVRFAQSIASVWMIKASSQIADLKVADSVFIYTDCLKLHVDNGVSKRIFVSLLGIVLCVL